MQVHDRPMKAAEPELLLQHNRFTVTYKLNEVNSWTRGRCAVPRVTNLADDAAAEQAGQQVGHQGVGLTVGQHGDDTEELPA